MHSKHIKLLAFFAMTALVIAIPGLSWGATASTLEVRVSDGNDDAEEAISDGGMYLTSSDLEMVKDDEDQIIGIRFQNVAIPSGATITDAHILFTADRASSVTTKLYIYGEATADSNQFSSSSNDISNRATTSEYKVWDVPQWTSAGDEHNSSPLEEIVQEIIDISGWSSGNAMTFIIKGDSGSMRAAESYNGNSGKAPLLHIEYTSTVIDAYPAASSDDAEERSDGSMYLNSSDLELIAEGSNDQLVGIRFPNINVPQGASITKAYVEFAVDESDNEDTDLVIRGEATDNALTFSSSDQNISSRDTTGDIKTEWNNVPAWYTEHEKQRSPDISAVIQAIVGRAGWSSGNALAIIISGSGTRVAESYDGAGGNTSLCPRLHIEYSDSPAAFITVDKTQLGETCYVGNNPASGEFTITNTGSADMYYSVSDDASWVSLSESSGILAAGESVTVTVTYATAAFTAGTHEATITVSDSAAANGPVELGVSVTIYDLPGETSGGHIPLYAQDIVNPSILILLDVSSSMTSLMNVSEGDNPKTPDLTDIVQEIVNRSAWSEGNAMAFLFTGSGTRTAVSYDGQSGSAPILHVEYNDGSDQIFEAQVSESSDDAEQYGNGNMYLTSSDLELAVDGSSTNAVGIRFQNVNIPNSATISNAYIEFTIATAGSTTTSLTITGHASDDAPTFSNAANVTSRTATTASVSWTDVEAWTGVTQKSRIEIGKSAISALVEDRDIDWGYGTWCAKTDDGYLAADNYTKIHVGCEEHDDDHQTDLQTEIAATTSHSGTPFMDSLIAARKYFTGTKSDEDGDSYVESSCQQLFLIDVTDGLGYYSSSVATITAETDNLADNNISAVAVGFGIDDATQINAMAKTANERGNADDSDDLYALHEEEAGVGVPFLANNETELIDVLSTIVDNVKTSLFHGAAPAPTTSSDLGDMLIVASFDASDWSGDLQAVAPDDEGNWTDNDGNWKVVKWTASEEIPLSRSIWTVDSSSTVVASSNYETDYLSCKFMGDIINSTPIVVNKPSYYYNFDDYRDFATDDTAADGDEVSAAAVRDAMVYVGANDGALHAFSLATGEEKWAFVPKSLQEKLEKGNVSSTTYDADYDMCDEDYLHQYYVDGSPQVADVYTSGSWKTILVSGLGEGGEAYFALDITSGNDFDDTDPTLYKWEFTDTDLGQSWSEPSINRIPTAGDPTWGVFFGSGYASTDAAQASKEAYLYGIQAENKADLWGTSNKVKMLKILLNYDGVTTDFTVGETITGGTSGDTATIVAVDSVEGVLELESLSGTFLDDETITGSGGGVALANGTVQDSSHINDALSSPLVVDLNGEGSYIADHIYAGNLYGNMFRVSNIGFGQTPEVTSLVDLGRVSNNINPIRAKASYAYSENPDEIWVYWGTGIYEHQADKANLDQQYFFGVRDQIGAEDAIDPDTGMAQLEAKYIEYNGTKYRYIDGTNPTKNSWKISLDNTTSDLLGSERIIKSSLVTGGIVFFTTFIPEDDVCSGSGEAWLFAVDYDTGLAPGLCTTDVNGDGVINMFDAYGIQNRVGGGSPTDVVDCEDLADLDPNGNGVVDPGDLVPDVNGDGTINWLDIAVVNDAEDVNQDGNIDWGDIGWDDVDRNGTVDFCEISGVADNLEDEIPDSDGNGIINCDDLAALDPNGNGVLDPGDLVPDYNGDDVIDWFDVAHVDNDIGDLNGDGPVDWGDAVFVDKDADGDGTVDFCEMAGEGIVNCAYYEALDPNGNGEFDPGDLVADGNGDGLINWFDIAGVGDVDLDGDVDEDDIGDVNGDSTIDWGDVGYDDENGDGVINWFDIAGVTDVDLDGDVDEDDIGDVNLDGSIDWEDVGTDVNGDGNVDWLDFANDVNGDRVIDHYDFQYSLDVNANGTINWVDAGFDLNGDGVVTWLDFANDVNGDGVIDHYDFQYELDVNANGVIDWMDIGIDESGGRVVNWLDFANDVNGDGQITYYDFQYELDANGDGELDGDDFVEDVNGDGLYNCWDLGDLNGDGDINWSDVNDCYEPVFDIDGDGHINEYDIAYDADGKPVPIAGIQLTNTDDGEGGIASDVVLINETIFVDTTEDGTKGEDVNLPALKVKLRNWRHQF